MNLVRAHVPRYRARMDRLRKASKQLSFNPRKGVGDVEKGDWHAKTGFFHLPAELRNEVYEMVAWNTVITLASVKTAKPASTPGLLLANKATRQEYRTILLSSASVQAHVKEYDFRNLMRFVSGLPRNDLLALGKNRRLEIRLQLHIKPKSVQRDTLALRLWFAWLHQYQPSSNGELAKSLEWTCEICPGLHDWWSVAKMDPWASTDAAQFRNRHLDILNEAHKALDGVCRSEKGVLQDGWDKWSADFHRARQSTVRPTIPLP